MFNKFDTPIKRFGFTLLAIGLLLIVGTLIYIALWTYRLHYYWELIVDYWSYPIRGGGYNCLHYGVILSIIGLFLSYLYDSTIGRLIAWIKHG